MAKPSIFSSNYEKKMKKRKRKIFFIVILCLLVLLSIIFFINKNSKGWKTTSLHKKSNVEFLDKFKKKKQEKPKQNPVVPEANKTIEKKESKVEEPKEGNFNIKIGDNSNIIATYEVEGNKKKFKELKGMISNVTYNINPSKNLMVICDKSSGSLIVVGVDEKVVDYTNPQYKSTSGNVFTRENVIKDFQNYNWCSNPKFVDDENFVYLTSLPWFDGRNTQYVWIVNKDTKEHINIQGAEGENVKFNELNANGLSVTIDGNNLILNKNGIVK